MIPLLLRFSITQLLLKLRLNNNNCHEIIDSFIYFSNLRRTFDCATLGGSYGSKTMRKNKDKA